jgi:hypothetical protein
MGFGGSGVRMCWGSRRRSRAAWTTILFDSATSKTPKGSELLLYAEHCVLCRLSDSEFEHGFGWNLDLLLSLGIKPCACHPLLFDQLAKARQNEFTRLFDRFVGERAEGIEESSSSLLIGLGRFSKSGLKFCFGHL